MKSPQTLRETLRRQWRSSDRRAERLLGSGEAWPVTFSIGRLNPQLLVSDLDSVRKHVEAWRQVSTGEVLWEENVYRAASAPVRIPKAWVLRKPTEWIEACQDSRIQSEFESLSKLISQTDRCDHASLVRRFSLWETKPIGDVVRAAKLASELSPNCANGRPLRMLAYEGVDTKFFERYEGLLKVFLDNRFDGQASRVGLAQFLNAFHETNNWLLLVDLDGALLPFERLRVRSTELQNTPLPAGRILLVENETSQHQLPPLRDTIAVLGSGFDLAWLSGRGPTGKQIAYWGDLDTWGLHCLGMARERQPDIVALLMAEDIYEANQTKAVPEETTPNSELLGLYVDERTLFMRLKEEPNGRLEQEFLPVELVHQELQRWHANTIVENL